MSLRVWLRLAELLVPLILAITIVVSWQADRRDRAQLATQLAAAQQTIAQAADHQKDRDAALTQTLAQIDNLKRTAVTPDQILKLLPQALNLPAPITLQADHRTPASVGARFIVPSVEATPTITPQEHPSQQAASEALPNNPSPKSSNATDAVIPAADLKPLYDFALDCRACQAKLTAAQADLSDEKTKSAALTKERDAALRAAKGGSALRRITRAAKWFALGAAAGLLASKAHR